jgi:hypothetical protein
MEVDLETTLAILLGAALVFATALWRQRRDQPGNPALIPWGGVQYLALIVAILMAAHLVTLLTGTPLVGRNG